LRAEFDVREDRPLEWAAPVVEWVVIIAETPASARKLRKGRLRWEARLPSVEDGEKIGKRRLHQR